SALHPAILTLSLLAETCDSAKVALQADPTPIAEAPSLDLLRKDYLSILTLIYTNTTKASLVLRPSPAYKASLAPLQELTKYVSSLATCTTLFDAHGLILTKEVRRHSNDLLEHVRVFAQTLQQQDDLSSKEYLIRAGAVHDAVEQIRKALPADNRAAVQGRLSSDRDILTDCLGEVQEMVKEGCGEEGELDDWVDEDGLEELGLGTSKPLSEAECLRAKRVRVTILIKWTCTLHKKILRDLRSQVFKDLPVQALDTLPSHSHGLLIASEDLVASLYAPQDSAAILRAVKSIDDKFQDFKKTLFASTSSVEELEEKMDKATLSDAGSSQKNAELPHGYDTSYRVLATCVSKASEESPPSL
ncbi:uncharacterized protein PHACADRAFT_95478, partial [Phanerochaete carnosa HHB-10118-sp]